MNLNNALKIFNLKHDYSLEELKKDYYSLLIKNHPDKFINYSEEIIKKQTDLTKEINSAYDVLLKKNSSDYEDFDLSSFHFDFDELFKSTSADNFYKFQKEYYEMQRLWHICLDLEKKDKYGLAIRLYEIGIMKCFTKKYEHCKRVYHLHRDLGTMLIQLGLFSDGLKYLKNGNAYYYLAQAYYKLQDYDNSLLYWEEELRHSKTVAPVSMIKVNIAKCYFMKKDFTKTLIIVEGNIILSINSKETKELAVFYKKLIINKKENMPIVAKKVCLMFLFCINEYLIMKKIDFRKTNVIKYFPQTMKIFKASEFDLSKNILKIQNMNGDFLKDLFKKISPQFKPIENPNLDYSESELYILLREIFGEGETVNYHIKYLQ